ncbi:MAG: LCP family protein [Faecousia sp.]
MSGRYERKKPQKAGGWKKPVLIVVLVIVVLIAALVIGTVVFYNSMLNKLNKVEVPKIDYSQIETEPVDTIEVTTEATTEATTEETTVATTEPHVASSADYINILMVGQASRAGEAERFADTMILCTINTYEKTVTLTSLLRDTLVQYPNYTDTAGKSHSGGKIKLTTIYHNGYICTNSVADAMGLMNLTLYKNFGIEVDYDVEIDFDAFVKAINLINGVSIELTAAEAAYLNDFHDRYYYEMTEGKNWLDGSTALAYVRMRKAEGDGESDIKRTARQRLFIQALLKKVSRLSVSELQNLANEILPMITVSMSNSEITNLLMTMLPMLSELEIKSSGTCPVRARGYSWGDTRDIYGDGFQHSVMLYDLDKNIEYMRAVTKGEGEIPETIPIDE